MQLDTLCKNAIQESNGSNMEKTKKWHNFEQVTEKADM